MEKRNILVTGCGGDIGQSILKILKSIDFIDQIIGSDIHDNHPGIFLCDQFYIVPRVSSNNYVEEIAEICKTHNVSILLPTSEPELRFHSKTLIFDNINETFGPFAMIIPNLESLTVGFDKLKTAMFLKDHNLPFPTTYALENMGAPILPCIFKDRYGSGSKTLYKVTNLPEWNFYKQNVTNLICQEFISEQEGEYTCGVFRAQNDIRTIIFKRILHGGYSGYGEICNNDAIDKVLRTLAEKLDLNGSINVQLRLRDNVPLVFEINPRFSSTVLFRHLFGYKDVLWAIEDKLHIPLSSYHPPANGGKFYKGFQEYIQNA